MLSIFSSYLLIENKNLLEKKQGGGAQKLHIASQPYSSYKYAYVGYSTKTVDSMCDVFETPQFTSELQDGVYYNLG